MDNLQTTTKIEMKYNLLYPFRKNMNLSKWLHNKNHLLLDKSGRAK